MPARRETTKLSELTLLKDSNWGIINGELCRVVGFVPMALVKDGKVLDISKTMPYASVHLECKKFPGQKITGFITHKLDFVNLWGAFKERGIGPDEEVIIIWTTKHYKYRLYKMLSFMMPKLWVMVFPKGAFELRTNPNLRPDLIGLTWEKTLVPIIDWKPEVMK